MVFLCLTNAFVNHVGKGYGLEILFIYGFVDRTPHPSQLTANLTFQQYWDILVPAIWLFLGYARNIALITASVAGCVCYFIKREQESTMHLLLLLVTWACLAFRFLLWPAWGEDRYYFSYDIIIMFCCGELIWPCVAVPLRRLDDWRKNFRFVP